jgi:hypothetical protein
LAVIGQSGGLNLWSETGWQTFEVPVLPQLLSHGSSLLLGWTVEGDLLQFDGSQWRAPLVLASLAPEPGQWEAEFLAPLPSAKTGTLVLSRGTAVPRLDLYDLP